MTAHNDSELRGPNAPLSKAEHSRVSRIINSLPFFHTLDRVVFIGHLVEAALPGDRGRISTPIRVITYRDATYRAVKEIHEYLLPNRLKLEGPYGIGCTMLSRELDIHGCVQRAPGELSEDGELGILSILGSIRTVIPQHDLQFLTGVSHKWANFLRERQHEMDLNNSSSIASTHRKDIGRLDYGDLFSTADWGTYSRLAAGYLLATYYTEESLREALREDPDLEWIAL